MFGPAYFDILWNLNSYLHDLGTITSLGLIFVRFTLLLASEYNMLWLERCGFVVCIYSDLFSRFFAIRFGDVDMFVVSVIPGYLRFLFMRVVVGRVFEDFDLFNVEGGIFGSAFVGCDLGGLVGAFTRYNGV